MKINLHFGKLDYIWKTNLLPINSIYLLFPSQKMQKRLIKTKVYCKLFCSVWKGMSHKPLKVAAAKKSFPSVFIIDTTCYDECFLFHVITGRHHFCKNLSLPKGLVQPSCCCVLRNKSFERSPQFMSIISTTILQCC